MNYTSVFLDCIKSNMNGIDEIKEKLDNSRIEYSELDDIINYISDDSKKIIEFEEQNIIEKYLFLISKTKEDYQAIKYLISTNNKKIQFLPQYVDALVDLESLSISLKEKKNTLSNTLDELSVEYDYKYINKKYYDIFTSKIIFIIDADEFINFISKLEISDDIKINIIKDVIHYNLHYYHYNYDETNEICKFIINHKEDLLIQSFSFMDNVNKYLDLSIELKDIVPASMEANLDVSNVLLAKRIWLSNKINKNYLEEDNIDFKGMINEYNLLVSMENKEIEEIERIIKEGH